MNIMAKISLHFVFHFGVNTIDCDSDEYYLFSTGQCAHVEQHHIRAFAMKVCFDSGHETLIFGIWTV